ncbi:MAG: alpha/beta fold hydrolase [Deltaproteobacteria bacterium]|nr:alpha/beta fold hydrolase [Deltaproteobacteria bacterium]
MLKATEIKERQREIEKRGNGETGKQRILSFSDSPCRSFPDSALLFLHGWATDSRVWKYQLEEFSKNHQVITIDLPGHGETDVWFEPTLKPAVEKLLQFTVHDSQFTGFIGIGWSLGGQTLLEVAAKMPGCFKGLVLIGVSPCFTAKRDFLFGQSAGVAKRMLKDMKKNFAGTMERFYPLNFTEDELLSPDARWFIELYKKPRTKPFCDSAVTSLEALLAIDLKDIIPDIKIPALIMHGEKDNVCPVDTGRYLAKNLPDARLEIFKDAGHAPFLTRPKEFNKIVKGFIETL